MRGWMCDLPVLGFQTDTTRITTLERMGIDHQSLTALFQGRQFRLTDVGGGADAGECWQKKNLIC